MNHVRKSILPSLSIAIAAAAVILCTTQVARAETATKFFTGSIVLDGNIADFFQADGLTPKPGVCVANDPNGLQEPPLAQASALDNVLHPSAFNQRRIMSAYNPSLNGGTVFIGIDLPGGSGADSNSKTVHSLPGNANPNYNDGVVGFNGGGGGFGRGKIVPFDADGNGEADTIGRTAAGGSLFRCPAPSGAIVDILNCGNANASGATDNPRTSSGETVGARENYVAQIFFGNGAMVAAQLQVGSTTAAGVADVTIMGSGTVAPVGGTVSTSTGATGVPLNWDIEIAITNVNAAVGDPCAVLNQTLLVDSGSNRDGAGQGEDQNTLVCTYQPPTQILCDVLFLQGGQVVMNSTCPNPILTLGRLVQSGPIDVVVVVSNSAQSAQSVINCNIDVSNIPGLSDQVAPGPLAPGDSSATLVGTLSDATPASYTVVANVSCQGQITGSCFPITTVCEDSFEFCGQCSVLINKLVACRPANGNCASATYGTVATGAKSATQNPAFCYSITVQNTSDVPLTLLSVSDDKLGNLTSKFPASLAAGQMATAFVSTNHTVNTMNTVTVTGRCVVAVNNGVPVTTNVTATSSATAQVVPASISCVKQVSTNGVNFFNMVDITLGVSTPVTYRVITTAGAIDLDKVTITDPLLQSFPECAQLPAAFKLAANQSVTNVLCTVPLVCTQIGSGVNTVSINAEVDVNNKQGICALDKDGLPIKVSTSCEATVNCVGAPKIQVIKEVICKQGTTACGSLAGSVYDGKKSASGVKNETGGICPTFCYRIIVKNTGTLPLVNVTVTDPLLGTGALPGYPANLAIGQSATNFFEKTLCVDTANTVTAIGEGSNETGLVQSQDSANVTVKTARIMCNKTISANGVNYASTASIPNDGQPHNVYYRIQVTNTSDAGVVLSNITVGDSALADCNIASQIPATLAAGASFTVNCQVLRNCNNIPGGSQVNTASVMAEVSSQNNTVCVTGSNGQPVKVMSSCSATLGCTGMPAVAITKEVVCKLGATACGSLPGSSYDGKKNATGVKSADGLLCPTFCYRIIVKNTGTVPLVNVAVTDPLFGAGNLAGFPTSLAIGQAVTNFYEKTLCVDTANTAGVIAEGINETGVVQAQDSANVAVKTARVSCVKQISTNGVDFAASATILNDGQPQQVFYRIQVTNNSDAGVSLSGITVTDPDLVGCNIAGQIPTTLAAGASFTVNCTTSLNCANIPSGQLVNTATVMAQADSQNSTVCVTDANGQPIRASSQCSATLNCVGCPVMVTKTACIIQAPPANTNTCSGGAIAMTLEYTGPSINGPTTVQITGGSGASVTYNLPMLLNGDVLMSPAENGFSIDATAHNQSKLGSTTTILINGKKEVLHTSCSCSANPDCNLKVCNPVCLDASSPDNPTGSKGPCSPLWTLLALKDPNKGLLTCQPTDTTDCKTTFTTEDCVKVKYTYVIKNSGPTVLTDVEVVDDKLGELPGSPLTLPANSSVTLMATGTVCCTTSNTVTVTALGGRCIAQASALITKCNPLTTCTVPYPFASTNPRTSIVFNESEVLRAFNVSIAEGCRPKQIRVFYNDEHALTLGIRRVIVKSTTGTATTDYTVTPLASNPGSALDPLVGTTALTGDQAGTDLAGRPIYPALFITDVTNDPSGLSGDWQFGGTAIAPHAVFGTWKAAVRTVDKTKNPAVVTVTPDADPAKNNYDLGAGSDPVPSGLINQGWGAEVRWDVDRLGLLPGHTYRLYFMVHDGDQNKSGGDVGHACANLTIGASELDCPPPACTLGYPYASSNPRTSVIFNESEVLRAFGPEIARAGGSIKLWYNDEHAMTLGIRRVNIKTSSGTTGTDFPLTALPANPGSALNPLVGATAQSSDFAGTDPVGRPMFPSLFLTDITTNPDSKAGDWQFGGTPIPPNAVFGTWKGAVKNVDKTKNPAEVTVTPDADPAKNNWNLGPGSDPAPAGLVNQGWGAEARWNVDDLIASGQLIRGHRYRAQFMVHDGDQNKSGGDVGQGCATIDVR